MRALKALVIGMAALIVAGLTVVIVTVIQQAGDDGTETAPAAPSAAAAVPGTETRIALPAGAEIAESRLDGAALLLRLRHTDGSETLEIFETATGRRIARIVIDRAR